ncbi:MAG: type II secretion system GspH family protein [Chitinispirillia bacterium]|nr:type II secretion system GspH family protein [Chitinispirillia bacterium]
MSRKTRGFTLVEVIVVGVLMTILALGLMSVFTMYSKNATELTADFRMQRNYDGLMDEIARNVRAASFVFTPSEFNNPDFDFAYAVSVITPTIVLTDLDRNPMRAYSVAKNYVEESTDGGVTWRPFSVAGDTIWLSPASLNIFSLASNRMTAQLDVTLKTVMAGDTLTLHCERGVFRCRL